MLLGNIHLQLAKPKEKEELHSPTKAAKIALTLRTFISSSGQHCLCFSQFDKAEKRALGFAGF